MNRFVPLRIISGYSFLKSGLTIYKIAASIKKEDFYGAGLSDLGVLYGVPSFVDEIEKLDKKYAIGMSLELDDHFVLYAKNEEGYRNLISLSSLFSEDKVTSEELKKHLGGIILIIETNYGAFKEKFPEGFDDHYLHYLAELSKLADNFYLGLEVTSKDEFAYAKEVRSFAFNYSYRTIAFPRIRYQKKNDAIILAIVDAIDKDEKLEIKEQEGQSYFMSFSDYQKIYTKQELENTCHLLNEIEFKYHQKRGSIAHFPVEDSIKELKERVFIGLKEKNINDQEHIDRANKELDVICQMGYEDYFLIVSDYVNYAKTNDILVGPGRGSAAGSLVSYLLNITEVDPLEYDLLFERFLNKERKTMPDIDVDFMDTRREDVVEYMREKYGNNHVANITTFQTIQAKQALRDIGRIYDIPTRHIDMLSKSITDKMTLRDAYRKLETFRNLVDSDKYFLEIVSLASKIEGLPRQAGLHAAGIVLNEDPLDQSLPVTIDMDGHYTSQYEKDYLEEQGFLKMDFLSLRNLTTIDTCLKLIKQNKNIDISFYDIPYKDDAVFSLLAKGETAGIFQLESSGMKNAIKIIEPQVFDDIVALLALFRPGPMDNIKEYKARKDGRVKVTYLNEDIKKILEPTYGILVYQEQIIQIATSMAGFSPAQADLFRRAVSHKDKDVLLKAKKDFVTGAIKKGYKEPFASTMFNDILKFANYGFNKSHAVVYAIIASRMGYLKYYYPLEFYISLLTTSSSANDAKFNEYVSELKLRGLSIYSPDINKSGINFTAKDDGLLFPLSFIKGVSEQIAHRIIDERSLNGDYKDYFDFIKRTHKQGVSEAVLTKLIYAGCFDKLYPSRASLLATIQYAIQYAELSFDSEGQMILDDTLEGQKQYFESHDDPIENLNNEYETLGIMLSDNPLRYKKDLLDKMNVVNLVEAKENRNTINIAGIISSIKTIKTKKSGDTMAFIKLFDEYGEIEVTIFPRLFKDKYTLLIKNNIVVISGHYEKKDEKESFVAESLSLLEE